MSNSWICLDASVVIRLVTTPQDKKLKQQFQEWQENYKLAAPHLLYFEVTNALYQYQRHGMLSEAIVKSALQTSQSLPIQLYSDELLHQQALALAGTYELSATYDAHYLALSQRLAANIWTIDKKLYNSVKTKLKLINLWH